MVGSSLYCYSIAVPVWFLKLTPAWNIAELALRGLSPHIYMSHVMTCTWSGQSPLGRPQDESLFYLRVMNIVCVKPCWAHIQKPRDHIADTPTNGFYDILPLDGMMIVIYSILCYHMPFAHFIKMLAKYLLGSYEVPHRCFWSEWWPSFTEDLYHASLLIGFQDIAMTSMITKPCMQ